MQNYTEEYREAYGAIANTLAQVNEWSRICSVHEYKLMEPVKCDGEQVYFCVVNMQDCKFEPIEDKPEALLKALATHRYVYFTFNDDAADAESFFDLGSEVVRGMVEEHYPALK